MLKMFIFSPVIMKKYLLTKVKFMTKNEFKLVYLLNFLFKQILKNPFLRVVFHFDSWYLKLEV